MLEGISMCFYKVIVQSMFKHVASENGQLVLTLSGPALSVVLQPEWRLRGPNAKNQS